MVEQVFNCEAKIVFCLHNDHRLHLESYVRHHSKETHIALKQGQFMSSLQRTDNLFIIIIKILVIELELWSTSCSKIIEPLYNDMLRGQSNYIVIYIEESLYQNSRYNDIADCVIVAGKLVT